MRPQVESIDDVSRDQLRTIQEKRTHDSKIIADLKKRKLLKMQKIISFKIQKAAKYALEMAKEETDLTAEMLASGSWKSATFSKLTHPRQRAEELLGLWERKYICISTSPTWPRSPTRRYVRGRKLTWNFFC